MTAQPHPAPPVALSTRRCPHCQRERSLRLGSERARALYLHDLTRQDAELRALRRQLAGRTTRPPRSAQAGDLALTGLAAAALAVEDAERRVRAVIPRVRAMRNPARRLGTTGRLALFTVICCCVGVIVRFGV